MRHDEIAQATPYRLAFVPHRGSAARMLGLLAAVLLWPWHSLVSAQEALPSLRLHVTDTAGVLGDRAEAIGSKLLAFDAATGNQVFVLTVPTTAGRPIEEYAVKVFENSKIGQRKLDNGALFVIATDDHRMRIEVGYGLEGVLTDARSSRILHDVVAPHLQEGRVAAGIEAGVDAIVASIAPADHSYSATPPQPKKKKTVGIPELIMAGLFSAAFWAIALWLGVIALPFSVLPIVLSLRLTVPGAFSGVFGWWVLTTMILPWLYLRWRVIEKGVRRYRLPHTRCAWCTWVWAFLFVPFFDGGRGQAGRRRGGSDATGDYSWSWSNSSDSGGSSCSDSSDSGGGGGESGGGGASASW